MKGGYRPNSGAKRKAFCFPGCACKICRQREAGRRFYERHCKVAGPASDSDLDRKASEWLKGIRA
jgi:hypothetical protein